MPSLVSVWPGADLQEREVYDMMGIRFTGHPNLRRILLWDGFEGYPLRKDYKESYFEEEVKPFKSRHPDGEHEWAEDRVPWKDNVTYPARLGSRPVDAARGAVPAHHGGGQAGERRRQANVQDRTHPGQHGAAASQHPRRLPHGDRASTARTSSGWSRRSVTCIAATRRSASATPTS